MKIRKLLKALLMVIRVETTQKPLGVEIVGLFTAIYTINTLVYYWFYDGSTAMNNFYYVTDRFTYFLFFLYLSFGRSKIAKFSRYTLALSAVRLFYTVCVAAGFVPIISSKYSSMALCIVLVILMMREFYAKWRLNT